jgi:hypothetical protein
MMDYRDEILPREAQLFAAAEEPTVPKHIHDRLFAAYLALHAEYIRYHLYRAERSRNCWRIVAFGLIAWGVVIAAWRWLR